MYSKLRLLLSVYGINREFTDEELNVLYEEAKSLIGLDSLTDTVFEEFVKDFNGKLYVTNRYPVDIDSLIVLLDNKQVTPLRVTKNGVIHFNTRLTGSILVKYSYLVNSDYEDKYVVPIVLELIKGIEGSNVASVSEGDISVSYKDNSSVQLDSLIERARNQFNASVRMI